MYTKDKRYRAADARNTVARSLTLLLVLLMVCVISGCQTVKPRNDVLVGLQEWAMLDPPSRLLSTREMPKEKAEMVRWLEQYLRGEYRVIDQRFVLTEPEFTEWALLGSKAGQYMEQQLGATYLRQEWKESGIDLVLLWKLDKDAPRYLALVMTTDPLPGPEERSLVGYFELIRSIIGMCA